jgi:hypothetical protein
MRARFPLHNVSGGLKNMNSMNRNSVLIPGVLCALVLLLQQGCQKPDSSPAQTPSAANEEPAENVESSPAANPDDVADHAHVAGSHGGTIVPLGRDSYHIEPVFEAEGRVSLFTLGADETRVLEIEARPTTGFVRLQSGTESAQVEFQPAPQPGDSEGKTSRLTAALPESHRNGPVEITIPGIVIDGDRFRFSFATPEPKHSGDAMPAKVADAEEQKLYLEPGGIYTAADIEANGGVTASQKFAGFKAKHDMNPKTGDKICPVTETLANPACSWVVNGQVYEFCCPPCVDEFVSWAKTQPDKIQPPASYVKK